jgi:lipid-A-disaccharide synthase
VEFTADAPELLSRARAAVVASGTATLECALALTPQVVVYRTSWLNWLVGRMLVRVPHIGLPNLLAGRGVVPELLQSQCNADASAAAVRPLLEETPQRAAQLDALRAISAELAPAGAASAAQKVAAEIAAMLEARP